MEKCMQDKPVQLSVFLPRDLYDKVEAISEAEYTSFAAVVRRAVAQYVEELDSKNSHTTN